MRGSLVTISVLVVATLSGCLGAPRTNIYSPEPTDTALSSSEPAPPQNRVPQLVVELQNASLAVTQTHFVGETFWANASKSRDPDGRIVNYTWRMARGALIDADFGERYGPVINATFDEPGDRVLVLIAKDDYGDAQQALQPFSVNQHRREEGTLVLSGIVPPGLPGLDSAFEDNYTLPVREGAILLSLNATFEADEASQVRLAIRAPDGSLLNESVSAQSPAWSISVPSPGAAGNYTAHIALVSGTVKDYRLDFTVWYGYY